MFNQQKVRLWKNRQKKKKRGDSVQEKSLLITSREVDLLDLTDFLQQKRINYKSVKRGRNQKGSYYIRKRGRFRGV